MRAWFIRSVIVAAAAGAGTVLLGWWAVPLIGGLYGLRPGRTGWAAAEAATGAALGWVMLIGWTAAQGPVEVLATRVGGVFGIPGVGFIGATILFAALMAGAATELVRGLARGGR